jgi:hypothetical protein
MKFPPEIRRMIYQEYISDTILKRKPRFLHYAKEPECNCGTPSQIKRKFHFVDLELAFTSKQDAAEVLPIFYRMRTMLFAYPCELIRLVKTNILLGASLRSAMVPWCGPVSDKSFSCWAPAVA